MCLSVIDRVGRKPLLLLGTLIKLMGTIWCTVYLYISNGDTCPHDPGSFLCWTPILATCLWRIGFSVGVGNIFYVFLGELVPLHQKKIIPPITIFTFNLSLFIMHKVTIK